MIPVVYDYELLRVQHEYCMQLLYLALEHFLFLSFSFVKQDIFSSADEQI